jgi:hypothetical protein
MAIVVSVGAAEHCNRLEHDLLQLRTIQHDLLQPESRLSSETTEKAVRFRGAP